MERRTFCRRISLTVTNENPIKSAECDVHYKLDDLPIFTKTLNLFLFTANGQAIETHQVQAKYIYQALDDFLDTNFQGMCEEYDRELEQSFKDQRWN